jgi:hypothetical protein
MYDAARPWLILDAFATAAQSRPVGRPLPLFVGIAAACGLLLGCGSGAKGPPDTWSQSSRTLRASWTVPSSSGIDLQLTRAGDVTGCTTTSKSRSERSTILIFNGEPAAFIRIGKTLEPGSRARTVCQVSGTVTGVLYGTDQFKHVKRAP